MRTTLRTLLYFLLLILSILVLFTGCNKDSTKSLPTTPAGDTVETPLREGYYFISSESSEDISYFYEITGGNITATTYTLEGLADASPLGTYIREGNLLKVTYSDGTHFDYTILADGSLQMENESLLEFRGSEEPKHMSTATTSTESNEQTQSSEDEILSFTGIYQGGSMSFENEAYLMIFKNNKSGIEITASENPEIAYFIVGESGLPEENKELIGQTFKVYYHSKEETDLNTDQKITVNTYISSEVTE